MTKKELEETQMKDNLINCQFTESFAETGGADQRAQEEQEIKDNGRCPKCSENLEMEIHHTLRMESRMIYKNRICFGGTDEEGQYRTIWFDSLEFLHWMDKKTLKEIKKQLVKYIKTK